MIWYILIFLAGLFLGIVLTSMLASRKLDELNQSWYETCLKITDGMDIREEKGGTSRRV